MTSGIYYWEILADTKTENELKIGITGEREFNFNTVVICRYIYILSRHSAIMILVGHSMDLGS